MTKHLRSLVAPTFATLLLAAGCPGETPDDSGPGESMCEEGANAECRRNIDCGGGSVCEKDDEADDTGCCVKIFCTTDADCSDTEECNLRKGLCVPSNLCNPADPENTGCSADQECIYNEGTPQCVDAPPDATACIVSPNPLYLADGAAADLQAVGRAADGSLVPHTTFTFASTIGTVSGSALTGACSDASPCTGTVTATADNGGATCTTEVTVFPAVATGDVRVSLFDANSREPVSGATVMVRVGDVKTTGTTDANGAYTFAAVGGTVQAVGAYPDDYQWQTVLSPTSNDIALHSVKIPDPTKVAGVKGRFDFDNVTTQGDIQLGIAGMSINSAITDLDFATLIGEIADYNVVLEGVTDSDGEVVPLPSGLVINLANEEIKGDFVSFGEPGTGILWALGGKVRLSEIGEIISGVTASDDVNVGSILAAVLPFFGRFDHATVTGIDLTEQNRPADPGEGVPVPYADWPFQELTGSDAVPLNTLLSQAAEYDVPTLPCVPGAGRVPTCTLNDEPAFNSGAILLSGVIVPGLGLVPLGLTAGLDDPDDQDSDDQRDGKLDYLEPTTTAPQTPAGKAIIDYAPPHDGLEGNLYVTIAIALDIDGLTEGALGASTITHVTSKYNENNNTFPTAFLEHQGGAFDRSATGVTFSLNAVGDADFYRLNLNQNAQDDDPEPEWNVWFQGDPGTITLADLRPDSTTGNRDDGADIQAFAIGTGYPGAAPSDMNDLFELNGTNMDSLIYYLGGWSSTACTEDDTDVEGAPFCLMTPAP
jgi:hypothetical protein